MMGSEKKITYETFSERVANRAKVSSAEANAFIHQFSATAGEALEEGDEVQLYRFGRFVTSHVDEHPGHNPGTGEAITIPDHARVDFHPYQALLVAVNWPFRHLRTRMLSEEKTDAWPGALVWALLLLALLMLILGGFAVNSWMSSRGGELAMPVAIPANMTLPSVHAEAVVKAEALVHAEVAAPVETAQVVATTRDFVVTNGDTLWGIAIAQWGDSSWWPVIYAENRADLAHGNPDLIETGSTLRLPVLSGGVAQPTNAALRQKTNAYRIVADDYGRASHSRAAEYKMVAKRGFAE